MTAYFAREWQRIAIGPGANAIPRAHADALLAAARAHPLGGDEGSAILCEVNGALRTAHMVGVLAAQAHAHAHPQAQAQAAGLRAGEGVSLEILPKVDREGAPPDTGPPDTRPTVAPDPTAPAVRARLIHMLEVALDLGGRFDIGFGAAAQLARQGETLLDILIHRFAEQLLAQVRRGLPRHYHPQEDDLAALRGSLNVTRQFTVHAVRPDRLACRFDALEADTPLLRVMKAAVVLLAGRARAFATQRLLAELRHALAMVPDVHPARLPWRAVRIDRSNARWRSLFTLARLLLQGDFQATHHAGSEAAAQATAPGQSLLFPMHALFEKYVEARLRPLVPSDHELVAQGGLRFCLGNWNDPLDEYGHTQGKHFQTKPDLILRRRRDRHVTAIIDTKWKRLDLADGTFGVAQADVYQLMAYARLYRCDRLILLYPAVPGQGSALLHDYGLAGGRERLTIATLDLTDPQRERDALAALMERREGKADKADQTALPSL